MSALHARPVSRPRKSAEDRRVEAQALHDTLTAKIEELTTSDGWATFLRAAATFRTYSLNNLMLIVAQRPDATQVAGFRQWQARGRQVRKGEKGIRIYGYRRQKVTREDDDGNESEATITRFPILTVFDLAQTDPIEGTEPVADPVQHLAGPDEQHITETITAHLATIGWTVEREQIAAGANGYTTVDGSRRVVIDDRLEPAQAAKTALHEAAHVLMHADDEPGEYVAHRGLKETEAESVAHVVAGLLGLDTSAYSVGYIAGWAQGDLDLIRSTATRVLATAHQLVDQLDPTDSSPAT